MANQKFNTGKTAAVSKPGHPGSAKPKGHSLKQPELTGKGYGLFKKYNF
jgi:hypothetical protein